MTGDLQYNRGQHIPQKKRRSRRAQQGQFLLPDLQAYEQRYLQVTGIGPFFQDGHLPETQCEITLAELSRDADGFLIALPEEFAKVTVGVGLLPAIGWGSIFQGEHLQRQMHAVLTRRVAATLRCIAPDERLAGSDLKTMTGGAVTGPLYELFEITQTYPEPCDENRVYLPVVELIRYFWCVNSRLSKRVFDGLLGLHNQHETIFSPQTSTWIAPDLYRVDAGRGLTDSELYTILRYCTAPQGREAWRSVFRSLQAQDIRQKPAYPDMPFALPQETQWDYDFISAWADRRYSHSGSVGVKLIQRLRNIDEQWKPPRVLVTLPDEDQTSAGQNGGEDVIFHRKPRRTGPLVYEAQSPSRRRALALNVEGDWLFNRLVERIDIKRPLAGGAAIIQALEVPDEATYLASTADGGWHQTDVGALSVKPLQAETSGAIPDRLDQLMEILKHLSPYGYETRLVPTPYTNTGVEWVFPKVKALNGRNWYWSLARNRPRRFLIAEIIKNDVTHYLFDAEMDGQSDFRSAGIVTSHDGKWQTTRLFDVATQLTLAAGRWSLVGKKIDLSTWRHTESDSLKNAARSLSVRLISIVES